MIYWLRWGPPRRFLIWLSYHIPQDSLAHDRLLEFLIPNDCVVVFHEREDAS